MSEALKSKHFALLQVPSDKNSYANTLANLASALQMDERRTAKVESIPNSVLDEESPSVHCTDLASPW